MNARIFERGCWPIRENTVLYSVSLTKNVKTQGNSSMHAKVVCTHDHDYFETFRKVFQSSNAIRPEIQTLRAIAIGSVLIFHMWDKVLPFGYLGVDV